jgi:hypothetical protein
MIYPLKSQKNTPPGKLRVERPDKRFYLKKPLFLLLLKQLIYNSISVFD